MSIVRSNAFELLSESASSDITNIELIDENMICASILENLEDIDELGEELSYHESFVPVIGGENENGKFYLIEHDNIGKVISFYEAQGHYCDEEIAMEKVCEHNKIPMEEAYLVLESDETYRRTVFNLSEKMKKEKDPKRKVTLKMQLDNIKERFRKMKQNEKLHLLKKPSKEVVDEAVLHDDPKKYTWFKTDNTKRIAAHVKPDFRKGIDDGNWSGFQSKILAELKKTKTEKEAREIKQFVISCGAVIGGSDATAIAFLFGLLGLMIYAITAEQERNRKELREWYRSEFVKEYDKHIDSLT